MKPLSFSKLVDSQLLFFRMHYSQENAGRKSSQIGANLENLIIRTNQAYEAQGLGWVKKVYSPTRNFGGNVIPYAGKPICDFDGYLKDVGYVAFDAKSTDDICWRPERDRIHQFLYLYRGWLNADKTKARCFYLIEKRAGCDSGWYCAHNLDVIKRDGVYVFREEDRIQPGLGTVMDYRKKLIETAQS
jgi:penicillin-binding protein-related factor A (putative recombinase)